MVTGALRLAAVVAGVAMTLVAGSAARAAEPVPKVAPAASTAPVPIQERIAGARFDFSAGLVEIDGAGAADLHAPNAQVARVAAERTARAVAARRLSAALAALPADRLGCRVPAAELVAHATNAAATTAIDWSSDGSVALTLAVPFAALAPPATPAGAGAVAAAAAILVDPTSRASVFKVHDLGCEPAPRHYATLAGARAAGGELSTAIVIVSDGRRHADTVLHDGRRHAELGDAAATDAEPAPRIVAVVASDDKHGPTGAKP